MSEKLYDAYEMAKNMSLDEAYDYCLKLEYDRERKHRDTDIGQIDHREILGKAIFLFMPGTNGGNDPLDFSRIGVLGK